MVKCPRCSSKKTIKSGKPKDRQRWKCLTCQRLFTEADQDRLSQLDKAFKNYLKPNGDLISASAVLGYKSPSLLYKWMEEPYISDPKYKLNPFVRIGVTKSYLSQIEERLKELPFPLFIKHLKSRAIIYYYPELRKSRQERNRWHSVKVMTLSNIRKNRETRGEEVFFDLKLHLKSDIKEIIISDRIEYDINNRKFLNVMPSQCVNFLLTHKYFDSILASCDKKFSARRKKDLSNQQFLDSFQSEKDRKEQLEVEKELDEAIQKFKK